MPCFSLNKRAVAVMALREGGHRVQLLGIIDHWLMMVPMFLGEYPKGISFLFKKEKGYVIIGMLKGRWVH